MLITRRCEYCKVYYKFDENKLKEKLMPLEDRFYCSLECLKKAITEEL